VIVKVGIIKGLGFSRKTSTKSLNTPLNPLKGERLKSSKKISLHTIANSSNREFTFCK